METDSADMIALPGDDVTGGDLSSGGDMIEIDPSQGEGDLSFSSGAAKEAIEKELGTSIDEYLARTQEIENSEVDTQKIVMKTDTVSFYANNISTMSGVGVSLFYELVNNSDLPVMFIGDAISVNGLVTTDTWVETVEPGGVSNGSIVVPEEAYSSFGIKTEDVKDIEFYLVAMSVRGDSSKCVFGDYVQSHKNAGDWSVSFDGEITGADIFDLPEVTLKVSGKVGENALSQRITYVNHTDHDLRVDIPRYKIGNKVSSSNMCFRIPPNKSGFKDIIWSVEEIQGVESVIANFKIVDLSAQSDEDSKGTQERVLIDKNVEILIK